MRIGKSFPKLSTPDFKSPSTKPGFKPDARPTFSPRPDINGNLPGTKPGLTPASKPTFSPRPDINGNLPGGKKPNLGLDGFDKPVGGLNKPSGFGGLDNAFGSLGNKFGGIGNGLANGLSAVGDVVGGVANGAAGLVGAGLQAATLPASALGLMDPSALLAGGPAMDPYAMTGGPAMDPYAAGLPPQPGALASSVPQQSDLGNILHSVANAVSVATQALDTVKALVGEGSASGILKKVAAEAAPQLANTLSPRIGLAGAGAQPEAPSAY